MSRYIKDIKNTDTGELIYPRTHAKAVMIDSERTLDEVLVDAPSDGKQYARRNGSWSEVAVDLSDYATREYVDGRMVVLSEAEYEALGDIVETDGVFYFITG